MTFSNIISLSPWCFEHFCKLKQLSSFSKTFASWNSYQAFPPGSKFPEIEHAQYEAAKPRVVESSPSQARKNSTEVGLYNYTCQQRCSTRCPLLCWLLFFKTMLHDTSHALRLQIGCLFSESIILIVVWHASIYPGRFSIYPEVGVYRWPRLLLLCLAK